MLELLTGKPVASPIVSKVETFEAPTEEYVALAKRLGVTLPKVITKLDLAQILIQENISAYDYRKVAAYMNRITPSGKNWQWKPLRAVDYEHSWRNLSFDRPPVADGSFCEAVYDKAVPYPVLLTVDKIEQATKDVPSSLKPAFFVTDYVSKNPDPFLMVCVPGNHDITDPLADNWRRRVVPIPERVFVIERWDEPSFRG